MRKIYIAVLLCFVGILTGRAQVEMCTEGQLTSSSGDHTPLWLNANRYGLSSLDLTNGYLRVGAFHSMDADSLRQWAVGYGADVAVAGGFTSRLVVQQAYVDVRWKKGLLSVGSKERQMELKNQRLSSGSQTFGINARPIPQVRVEMPDYWQVPGLKGWLGLKGHLAYGLTTDDKWQKEFTDDLSRRTEHAMYHSKAGYMKIGPGSVNVEFGLEMACEFGGKGFNIDNGGKTPVTIKNESNLKSFYHALIPGGTDPTDSSFVNSEGNHLGSWVIRLNIDRPTWNLGLYADQFFEDHSQMFHISFNGYGLGDEKGVRKKNRYFVYDFKDWMLGAELHLKQTPWLSHVVLEYLYTKYQGGPVYHDHTANISEHICGNDKYYNHNIFTGWQHWGQVMGNPLYLSPLYNKDGQIMVENNRFVAWHAGIDGQLHESLAYRVLATWQRGYGTYDKPYIDPEENVSLMAEAEYRFPASSKLNGWAVKGAVALDRGKIYGDNTGFQLTVSRRGMLNLKKKK